MKLADTIEKDTETLRLKLTDIWYTIDDSGGSKDPIIHIEARDSDRQNHHVEVRDFQPYFTVPRSTLDDSTLHALETHHSVTDISMYRDGVVPYKWRDSVEYGGDDISKRNSSPEVDKIYESDSEWARTPMVRIEVNLPYDVRELREEFELSGEADVRYPQRFLIDSGVYTTFEVPIVAKERRVTVDDVTPIADDTLSAVRPRICYYDIEVETSEDGPAVVSEKGCEQTRNPITAIAAHDSYQDGKTRAWILEDDSWNGELTIPSNVTICETETELLEQFCQFLVDRRFDVLSGWNSSGFDDPYFINRCLAKEITAVQHISPTKDVSRMNGNGQWRNSDLKGIILLDLLEAYKNVSRRKLSSYSLDVVAEGEGLDVQKMDVDEQTAYYEDPQTFIDYVRTDVDVLVELNQNKEII